MYRKMLNVTFFAKCYILDTPCPIIISYFKLIQETLKKDTSHASNATRNPFVICDDF